jgi:hypothetical protein
MPDLGILEGLLLPKLAVNRALVGAESVLDRSREDPSGHEWSRPICKNRRSEGVPNRLRGGATLLGMQDLSVRSSLNEEITGGRVCRTAGGWPIIWSRNQRQGGARRQHEFRGHGKCHPALLAGDGVPPASGCVVPDACLRPRQEATGCQRTCRSAGQRVGERPRPLKAVAPVRIRSGLPTSTSITRPLTWTNEGQVRLWASVCARSVCPRPCPAPRSRWTLLAPVGTLLGMSAPPPFDPERELQRLQRNLRFCDNHPPTG